ncbi:MAG TPA: hypothetical protein VH969_03595 [Actinophytocola sp.]|uniref:hypothetical protein n=1 Tax=Actinophytocola sp. TaxID=1872138 RepID=UPI002F91C6C3
MQPGENVQERIDREAKAVRSVLAEVEQRRREAAEAGLSFTALTEDQLLRKLRSVNSPMIVWQSWGSGSPGSSIAYNVGINNPDPTDWVSLFGHVFVGSANVAPDIGDALALVDTRFPRLTMPAFAGLTVKAATTEQLNFSLKIPTGIDLTNYMGNSVLYQATWHDRAIYLDRGLFVFAVN